MEQKKRHDISNTFESSSIVIPVIREHISVSKKSIETAKINVSKKVAEEPFDKDMLLSNEEVIVERKPVNIFIDEDSPGIRFDGNTTIIPVLKEVMVKRLLLVEEIHITKHQKEAPASIHEVIRQEEVLVIRTETAADGSKS